MTKKAGKPVTLAERAASKQVARTPAAKSHILPAPKGARTVSHRRIEQAVDKVFRSRAHADA